MTDDNTLEEYKRLSRLLNDIVRKKKETYLLSDALRQALNFQAQIELSYNAAKYSLLYQANKTANALELSENDLKKVETSFRKIRNIMAVIELCRACGMSLYEERIFDFLMSKEFGTVHNNTNTDLVQQIQSVLGQYADKLNKLEKKHE